MSSERLQRIGIIGGGIIGLATALKLRERLPDAEIVVWEKESEPGRHQSTHNSGVLHAGLYYKPGSLKARLAVEGLHMMVQFCREHGIAHDLCGKIVVAIDDTELPRLKLLLERGKANGLRGLEWLSQDRIKEFEPHAAGVAALRVPQEGIVDYHAVIHKMTEILRASGGELQTSANVVDIVADGDSWIIKKKRGEDRCDFLINCAGLYSDKVSVLAGEKRNVRIVPFRGEYFKLRAGSEGLVRHLIYPVPDPLFPFLGVHFTRMIHGGVEAGPNAVLAGAREGYTKRIIHPAELLDALSYRGLWNFIAQHKRMCWEEIKRSFSKKLFCASLQRLIPELQESDLEEGGAGVRAQAMNPQGELLQDFCFIERPNALHVLNAPSPGATASLAIGGEIARKVGSQMS
ncbi:MAG: hydroxyglutarate oxidase [Verrucomicrobia bacterium RIFCSPHIGHO2_12_FULL_41_10]|nr:MAG: hydroxyglutarate oxidase [Verrucomicrobia bacterium RIFCSPHIGHO2_12_FULL_41_10]